MQMDFHYYGTYCAAFLAGYSHQESQSIAYAAQFVDCCSRTFIKSVKGPSMAATTQLSMEMADARTDVTGLQDITRIWASFHFLPFDLYAQLPDRSHRYMQKYRMICNPNGRLVADTVQLAKGQGLEACSLAMHVLADTWAHRYFAGTPSFVINNATHFVELITIDGEEQERPIQFSHNPRTEEDVEKNHFVSSLYQNNENSMMNLGHGRAGHLPDYSFMRYKFLPAWGNYKEIIKDNPDDYYHAFCQMVYALKTLRDEHLTFEVDTYDYQAVEPYKEEIFAILKKRQVNACEDWKALGQKMSGCLIDDFDINRYAKEYMEAPVRHKSFLGRFFLAAMEQKSMVTRKIFESGNLLAGISIDYEEVGFKGMKEFKRLVKAKESREV